MKWNEILYNNVKNYCELNDINLGDFEKSLNVGKGYMSRQATTGTISVQIVMNIAKRLNSAIDDLLSEDIFAGAIKEKKRDEIKWQIAVLQGKLENLYDDNSSDNKTKG